VTLQIGVCVATVVTKESEEVEEAKEVEEESSWKRHRERKALRANGYVGVRNADTYFFSGEL
jgi:hypothetical protein